ncbi:cysteine hydrolase family protein [Anaerobaca lacustris]|uniref:nicotinamidase n=1 Tax=Anaerobaca lacustris TaxID=3044600 RepID=A0AAW6U337_9BACT|nr:isochorismatase family protein [Sedimentisphaerales bacterium M17dextr]
MKKNPLFWDVDTQFDFMQPEGRLYVPGAETIIDAVSQVRRFALDNGFSILADVDWHTPDNPEISDHPDYKTTFPPHCMAGEPGSERIGYVGTRPIDFVPVEEMDVADLRRLAEKEPFHIVIRKQSLSVFDNPNTDRLIDAIEPKQVVVFGVALDFCVSYVVKGLAKRSGTELTLLRDAVKGLQSRPDDDIYDEFRRMGVAIVTFDEFKRRLTCG